MHALTVALLAGVDLLGLVLLAWAVLGELAEVRAERTVRPAAAVPASSAVATVELPAIRPAAHRGRHRAPAGGAR